MDIRSGRPGGKLSNFQPRPFTFDGVECASMEGLLQSFKFEDVNVQEHVCTLAGIQAKRRGKKRDKRWKSVQTLWWKGVAYPRKSDEYQALLDRAYDALVENTAFRRALLSTGDAVLTHSIGKSKESETCLTEREFCRRLMHLRKRLRKEEEA
jgi:predicted NAD-dependent protein-ADP-ribosyltransferase YbiA (DUF1768 family)